MRRGDVGPFGVVTLVLVLLLQVSALAAVLSRDTWTLSLVLALVTSRLVLPMACSRGVPGARADGLGSTVAGSVSWPGSLLSAVLAAALVGAVALATGAPSSPGRLVVAVVLPLLLAGLLVLRCVRRLGGITGDVLGACVEVAFTASLVVLASG
jgi:adenosylcobinamide-GDP ribazoletransferase